LPIHGDFNCPCQTCCAARAVSSVQSIHHARLVPGEGVESTYSQEMQRTADEAAGIWRIVLPGIDKGSL
jgi:hypothetical protein